MVRFSAFAVALTAVVGIASIGVAQAAPPITDTRYVVADNQPTAAPNVAEGIFISPKYKPAEPRAPKPRIWLSMGFGG